MCLVSYREDGFDIPATMEKQAFSHFHNAQQLAPELIVAFESEIQAFRKLEDPKRAIAAGERLLERFPEHLPTLESLVRDCLEGDECLRGLEYARRAYRLKPLDAKTGTMAWAMHVGAARHCALRGDWEQGRRLFDEAEEFPHAPESANMFAARRAMFEQKAGEQEKAEAWLARAKEGWPDELPLKLILAVESRRYQMPPEVSALYMNAWRAALRQPKPSSFALGKVSEIMAAYAVYSVTENLVHQERDEVIDFLNKHKRKKLEPNDLRQVCHCLHVCEEEDLLESYVRKGRKAYPKHPYFAYLVGEMQMKLGPYEADRRLARREFQIALAGIEKSGDPRDKELLEPIRQSLHYLGDERHDDIPRGFSPATLFGAIERMCDQMGVDPEDLMHDLERAFEQTSKGRR